MYTKNLLTFKHKIIDDFFLNHAVQNTQINKINYADFVKNNRKGMSLSVINSQMIWPFHDSLSTASKSTKQLSAPITWGSSS